MCTRTDVIYARYSSEMQRADSITDQVRRCRDGLDQKGIAHDHFEVIKDEAISGTAERRPGFDRIKAMIARGGLGTLVVSEQSRLSRGDNATGFIQDIVFNGGRFIAVAENVDTDNQSWKLLAGISGIHHARSNEDTAQRVRGGHEGRIHDGDGSAGDFPYGYASAFENPAAAASYNGRGPKPKRVVVIHDDEAGVVREIFRRFADQKQSMSKIVRWWESKKHEFPPITRSRIHHAHVRRILANEKYIGTWTYGRTTTVRESSGRKKQVPARPHQRVTVKSRPKLRIIAQDLWDRAEKRLGELREIYGMKPTGKKRGPAAHYRLLYDRSLLGGLVTCATCGARMLSGSSDGKKGLACPNRRVGKCTMSVRVPYAKAERAVLDVLIDVLEEYPEWLALAADAARAHAERLLKAVPDDLSRARRDLAEVEAKIDKLVDALADGTSSGALKSRLVKFEQEKETLERRVRDASALTSASAAMPEDAFIAGELAQLGGLIQANAEALIPHLRPLIETIEAKGIVQPGKTRGYVCLRLRLNAWAIIRKALGNRLPEALLSLLSDRRDGHGGQATAAEVFEFDLGKLSRVDQLAPQIVEMRRQKVKWKEIARRTGLTIGNAYNMYKRLADAMAKAA